MTTQTPEESGSELTRVTVNLIPKAAEAVESSAARERLSKTDVINRALQVYDFVTTQTAIGSELLFRRPNGDIEAVHIL